MSTVTFYLVLVVVSLYEWGQNQNKATWARIVYTTLTSFLVVFSVWMGHTFIYRIVPYFWR